MVENGRFLGLQAWSFNAVVVDDYIGFGFDCFSGAATVGQGGRKGWN